MPVIHQELVALEKHVTTERVSCYAEASGDYNPIHLDPAFAAQTSFGRPIAHGMLVLAFLSEMLAHGYGGAWLTGGSLKVRFKAPVYVGDRVTTFGTLKGVAEAGDSRTATYSVGCRNQEGADVVMGEAAVTLSSEGSSGA